MGESVKKRARKSSRDLCEDAVTNRELPKPTGFATKEEAGQGEVPRPAFCGTRENEEGLMRVRRVACHNNPSMVRYYRGALLETTVFPVKNGNHCNGCRLCIRTGKGARRNSQKDRAGSGEVPVDRP